MAELISVIVTTWNREDALDAVLRSLSLQTDRDFEVIVADDGSGPATARLIEESTMASLSPFPPRSSMSTWSSRTMAFLIIMPIRLRNPSIAMKSKDLRVNRSPMVTPTMERGNVRMMIHHVY